MGKRIGDNHPPDCSVDTIIEDPSRRNSYPMVNFDTRPTKLYVDLNAIEHNIKEIRKKLKPQTGIMAVIKAFGYGSGAVNIVNTLIKNGINWLAVAIPEEGIQLREEGVKLPILVFGYPFDLRMIMKYNLTPTISDFELAEELDKLAQKENRIVKIHIEIDTGMGRTGIPEKKSVEFITRILSFKNIQIEGLYTHFAGSDSDMEYTRLQITRFEKILTELKKRNIKIPLVHACNSAGIINFPEAHYDLVRPGLMLYGYYPNENLKNKINLLPSLALKSKITFLKKVPAGTSISYNRTFITNRPSKIATIPLGYADGIKRALSNKGYVMINGMKAPIVGTICMDMFMVDVTHIPNVKAGDDVIIFDDHNITVEELAQICGTINYEIISTISNRIPRVYLK